MSTIALIMAISSKGQNAAPSLPFVGCVSYGMAEKREAPKGASVKRSISLHDAGMLAYYKSAEIGLTAPRGWNCEGYSDSSGWGNVSESGADSRRAQMAELQGPRDRPPADQWRDPLWEFSDRGSHFPGLPDFSLAGSAYVGGRC